MQRELVSELLDELLVSALPSVLKTASEALGPRLILALLRCSILCPKTIQKDCADLEIFTGEIQERCRLYAFCPEC